MRLSDIMSTAATNYADEEVPEKFKPILHLAQRIQSANVPIVNIVREIEGGDHKVTFSRGFDFTISGDKSQQILVVSANEVAISILDGTKTSEFNAFGFSSSTNSPTTALGDIADWSGRNVDKAWHGELGAYLDEVEQAMNSPKRLPPSFLAAQPTGMA